MGDSGVLSGLDRVRLRCARCALAFAEGNFRQFDWLRRSAPQKVRFR